MKYMGSKRRIAKEILPIILKDRKPGQYYVEPFMGGCNMLEQVSNPRIGNDTHEYLVSMFAAITNGWEPPSSVTEQEYRDIRQTPQMFNDALVGFVGFGCSYGGKWWGGYARGNNKDGSPRNYCNESKRNLQKQKNKLIGVEWYNYSYNLLALPSNSIIYCDPPYAGTTEYKDEFNHQEFWQWCREMAQDGHQVFISEYNAPEDFKCVWSKEIVSSLTKNTGSKKGVEKLFVPSIS